MTRAKIAAVLAGLTVVFQSTVVTASEIRDCGSQTATVSIPACTKALARKSIPKQQQAILLMQRAYSYSAIHDYDAAREDVTRSIQLNANNAFAFAVRAWVELNSQRWQEAINDSTKVISINPNFAGAYDMRGVAYTSLGKFKEAEADHQKAIRLDPKKAVHYSNRASMWGKQNNYEKMLADFDAAIAIDPKFQLAFAGRCHTLELLGKMDAALIDCNRAAELSPQSPIGYLNRASLYRKQGQLEKALVDYDQAIRIDPDTPGSFAGRGEVYRTLGDQEKAIRDFDRSISLNDRYLSAYVFRGLANEARGRLDDARADFLVATRLSPTGASSATSKQALTFFNFSREQAIARSRLLVLDGASDKERVEARGPDVTERRIALVIGNSNYSGTQTLANPVNDARLISQLLRKLGFEVMEGFDKDALSMKQLVLDYMRQAPSSKLSVVYYAGHGMQIEGRNYIIPTDADLTKTNFANDLIDVDFLISGLDDPIRANLFVLDACRDNPFINTAGNAAQDRSRGMRSGFAVPGNINVGTTSGSGTLIAFATAPGQVASDGEGSNSPFTSALARHIPTPGLEVQQMLTRVRAEVVAATKNKQVPWSNSSLLGDVYFASRN